MVSLVCHAFYVVTKSVSFASQDLTPQSDSVSVHAGGKLVFLSEIL